MIVEYHLENEVQPAYIIAYNIIVLLHYSLSHPGLSGFIENRLCIELLDQLLCVV